MGSTRNVRGLGERAFAIVASLMIVLATPGVAGAVTLQGGTSSVADAGISPGVSVPDTVIDDGSDSTIEVAYNATGRLTANDTGIQLTGPAEFLAVNDTLASTSGVATLTIPADVYGGGNFTVVGTLVDTSTGTPIANDSATLTVASNASVTGFALSPSSVAPGENVTVSALAENVGDAAADVTVALYEDGLAVDSTRITVAAGGNETVTFDRSYSRTGTHALSVNNHPEQTVNVTESTGSVYVSDYVVPKRTVNVSEPLWVNATVTNTKSTSENATVDLYENGTVVETQVVTVPADGNESVPFLAAFGTAGDHTVTVNGAPSTNVTVLSDDGGSANLSIVGYGLSKNPVNVSESFWVNATVENTGDVEGSMVVEFYRDGTWWDAHEVVVSPNATATTAFSTNFSTLGSHTVNVTDRSPTLVNVTSGSDEDGDASTLSVVDQRVPKRTVNVSESFWVNATVANSGDAEGWMWVDLYGNGTVVDSQNVTVAASSSTNVSFPTAFGTSGNHTVNVTGWSPTNVTVLGDGTANLSVVEYAVPKRTVNVSESFWVNATVENTGGAEGSMVVEFYRDGRPWDWREVSVGPGTTAEASFLTNFSTSGNHTVNVTGRSPTTVEVFGGYDDDGSNVTVEYAVSATTVDESESFWVNATVHNTGANDTSETVTLYADGAAVESRTVNASAGTNETVTFSHSFPDADSHTVTVNGLPTTTIDVQPSDSGSASLVVTDMDVSKWHVDTNETVAVNATVENRGSERGTKTVEFYVAGLAEQSTSVTLDAGNSTTVSFTESFDTAGNWGVWVTGWAEHVVQVTDGGPNGSYVVTGDLTHVDGSAPDMSQVVLSAEHSSGLYQVQLQNGSADGSDLNRTYDLDGLGVDPTTEFRIDVTLNGSVPRLLLGNGKNLSWTRSRNADGTWNVSIHARGSHVESIFDRPTSPWPEGENDTADTFHNVSVSLAIDPLDVLDESDRHTMNGTVFATDAQQFSSPQYTPPAPEQPPELSLYVAGPHYGVNGSTNTGYFDAFVPDAVLAEWNVSSPSELAGSYQGARSAVDARSVPGGMRVELDIHYSDGDVAIVKSSSDSTGYIDGTVTNASTATLEGASVTVRNATTGQTAATTTTDANGNYSASVGGGTYNVTASASGYEDATVPNVQVTEGSTTAVDLTLAATTTGTLSGTVLNGSDDTAVQGASVEVSNASGTVAAATTDARGAFDVSLVEGSYDVKASADGYDPAELSGVPVTAGETTTVTPRLTPTAGDSGSTGFVNGTVTNVSGVPVSGVTVAAYLPDGVRTTTTDANGNYSVAVAPDLVGLEYNASGYGAHSEFVEVTANNTTRVDVTLREPGTVAGVVRDENGDPVPGATVDVWGPTAAQATTAADGSYSISVGAGEYAVEVRADGYPRRTSRGVRVNASETTTLNATLREPGFITGTVRDPNGDALSNVWVGAEDGAEFAYDVTGASGTFNVSAVPGNYSVTGFGPNGGVVASSGTVRVTEGNTTDVGTLTTVNPTVVDSSVRHVGGTAPDVANLSVNARTFGGMLMVQLTNASGNARGMPVDLSDLGADNTTRFEIELTVEDYDPSALLWGARNVSWTATPNATNANATDIAVRTNTVHLAGIEKDSLPVGPITRRSPEDIRWPTGAEDRADVGWNNTVYFMLYDLGSMPVDVSSSLENMTVVTNAQTFSRPQMVDGTLRVYAAGPHYTKQGKTHDGFYSAFVPNAQLEAWNVTDPGTELEASWQGDPESYTVEVTPRGAWIHLDIHYSDGYAEVTAVDTTDPTADAGRDATVDEDTQVAFDGSNSTDDVGVDTYRWAFGDGTDATGVSPTHTYTEPGTYTVTLNVTDAAGNRDTDSLVMTVEDTTAPTAEAGSDRTVTEEDAVAFDGSASSDNVEVDAYGWDFGDGTTATGAAPSHTYGSDGTYTVTLTVTDAAGNSATDTLTVTVEAASSGGGGSGGGNGNADEPDGTDRETVDSDDGPTEDTTDDSNTTDAVDETVVESTGTANVSATTDGNRTSVKISGAAANETVSVTLGDVDRSVETEGGGVESVNATFDAAGDFDMNVSYSPEKPDAESVTDVDRDRTVGYVNVQHNADDEVLRDVTFTVRVGADAVAERGVDPSDLALYRYHDGAWTELETSLLGHHGDHYRFRAVSPGLSVFAIAPRGITEPDIGAVAASLGATSVAVGEPVAVSATVGNDGRGAGEATLTLSVDGAPAATRTVSLAPGETATVTFRYAPSEPGSHELSVDGVVAGTVEAGATGGTSTPMATPTPTPSDTTDESSTGSDVGTEPRPATPAETSSESGAGFGPALAVIALFAAALLTGRRRD